jgi:molybdopterin converting factor small subunit
MIVNIRFIGSLRSESGKSGLKLDFQRNIPLREVLKILAEKKPNLGRALVGAELDDPRLNALVIVNGKEISVLEGLDTMLKDRDEIVFVPVLHGG